VRKEKFKPEEENLDWLVSYADMMTLIACFFILMMAFANYDPVGFNIKAEQLSKYFRKDKYKSSELKLKEITEEIARHEALKKMTKISLKDSELIVGFTGDLLFEDGEGVLSDKQSSTLDSLVEIIKIKIPDGRILVEGHADDNLVENQWYISLMRSSEVAKRFELAGFKAENISAVARSNSIKAVESINEKGQWDATKAKYNRRVVVRVLTQKEKKNVKMGFGVYFRDAKEDVGDNLEEKDLKGFKINE
jgi:chemotaxis protein MotB